MSTNTEKNIIYLTKEMFEAHERAKRLHEKLKDLNKQREQSTIDLENLRGNHEHEKERVPTRRRFFQNQVVRKTIFLEAKALETAAEADKRRSIVANLLEQFEDERERAEGQAKKDIGRVQQKLDEWEEKTMPKIDELTLAIPELETEIADIETELKEYHPIIS